MNASGGRSSIFLLVGEGFYAIVSKVNFCCSYYRMYEVGLMATADLECVEKIALYRPEQE
jgi:hypothetical protein